MHHSGSPAHTWSSVTTVSYSFHEAEGCADYVVVFTSDRDITVKPNVSVTYNPASASTGSCAGAPWAPHHVGSSHGARSAPRLRGAGRSRRQNFAKVVASR